MIRVAAHPLFMALLAVSQLGTPVTYRGGAAAPHPHMFLQLWHDAASGSFTHQAHQPDSQQHHAHGGHSMRKAPPPPLQVGNGDAPNLTVSPFVVSDWGVPVLHASSTPSMDHESPRNRREFDRAVIPVGRPPMPEPPPPRLAAI